MWRTLLGFIVDEAIGAAKRKLARPSDAELMVVARNIVALGAERSAVELLADAERWLAARNIPLTDDVLRRMRLAVAVECMERDLAKIAAGTRVVADRLSTVK